MARRVAVSCCVLFACVVGCKDSAYDVFMQGIKLEGEATNGPCQLKSDGSQQAASLSARQVAKCLRGTEAALERYEKAQAMGYDDADFTRILERARARKAHLENMRVMIQQMERDAAEAELANPKTADDSWQ